MSDILDLDAIEKAAKEATLGDWNAFSMAIDPSIILALCARIRELEAGGVR